MTEAAPRRPLVHSWTRRIEYHAAMFAAWDDATRRIVIPEDADARAKEARDDEWRRLTTTGRSARRSTGKTTSCVNTHEVGGPQFGTREFAETVFAVSTYNITLR